MHQEISDLERWEAAGRLRPEEKKRLEEYRRLLDKILVLPGMELTATFGFHILAIFDEKTPIRSLEHVLLSLNVPFDSLDEGDTEVGATSDVLTAYRIMADAGALVIAAHANSSHGVAMFGFGFGGQTRIAYTQDPHLHALEVTDLESRRRRSTASFFNGSRPEYPRRMHCIQGSDAHRISGRGKNLGVGERTTEILLPEVSFSGLKEVFLGKDFARTRPSRRAAEEPFDHVLAARNEGPTIVQSFHESMTRQGGRLHAILRDVVAYANGNGGTIYIGISPNTKVAPKGVPDPQAAMAELKGEIDHLVTPPLTPELSVVNSQGKDIIRVVVPKGEDRPYVLEGSKIYIRQETETNLAMRDEIVALIERTLEEPGRKAQAPAPARPAPQEKQPPKKQEQPAPVAQSAAAPPVQDGRVAPPRTGVEIVDSEEREGVLYHTMRDLRDGGEVHNVTRSSARRLWRYAIALKEKGTFAENKVTWKDNLGLWHKYLRSGRPHYDLVQKDRDKGIHIYYGVSDDGIHGPWRSVVGVDEA
ncbi:MAG: putative DNA binding domain-containing protein [Anaerolineae bacterium]|nr:putative DNA binding domain-containing protein [Anaerolineae bacterium]